VTLGVALFFVFIIFKLLLALDTNEFGPDFAFEFVFLLLAVLFLFELDTAVVLATLVLELKLAFLFLQVVPVVESTSVWSTLLLLFGLTSSSVSESSLLLVSSAS
jgi:hypothetical protein